VSETITVTKLELVPPAAFSIVYTSPYRPGTAGGVTLTIDPSTISACTAESALSTAETVNALPSGSESFTST
jgi:hypothetical protein